MVIETLLQSPCVKDRGVYEDGTHLPLGPDEQTEQNAAKEYSLETPNLIQSPFHIPREELQIVGRVG